MGPLSAKQHREYLKLEADEQRKNAAFAQEQQRKEQLHMLKLKEAEAKASQGIAHKEENHAMKLAEGTAKVPRINRQKLGLPSMNPLAGAEVLRPGQKKLPGMIPQGTDTVPAMLTPGEAVIPAPAAQDPKNKKAIKRMVDEGRKKNKYLRDGTVNIVKTDSPVPRPTAGTYGGVPQQVQQAAGYMNGTPEVPNTLGGVIGVAKYELGTENVFGQEDPNKYFGNPISELPQQDQWEVPPMQTDPEIQVAEAPKLVQPIYDFNSIDSKTLLPKPQPKEAPVVVPVAVEPAPVAQLPVAKAVPVKTTIAAPSVPVMPDETIAETNRLRNANAEIEWANTPAAENETSQEGSLAKLIPVAPGDMASASNALRSRVKSIEDYMKMQGYDDSKPKDEKGFLSSFKDAFTYSGAKKLLGLNDQEVARLAVMTLGGRLRGFNLGHSLAFAGKNAFIESSRRQAQEDAERRAAQRNAVTMRQQDIRQEIADQRAAAKEKHDMFVAENNRKIAEAKEQYLRDRDDKRFAQQMTILTQNQMAQDARMQAQLGNQWKMLIAREDYRDRREDLKDQRNEPQRYQQLVNDTGTTVNNILNTQFGSDTKKINAARQSMPTAGEITNQAYRYFRRSGYDLNNVDSTSSMNAIMSMATRDMANDAATGKLSKDTADITPYVAKYIIQLRTGLDSSLFKVGDKDMNPEKLVTLEQTAISNSASPEAARAKLNALAQDWKTNGAKYRKEFSGSTNESAFYQWANSQLNKKESK